MNRQDKKNYSSIEAIKAGLAPALISVAFLALTVTIASPVTKSEKGLDKASSSKSSSASGAASLWFTTAQDLEARGYLNLAFSAYARTLSAKDGSLSVETSIACLDALERIQGSRKNLALPPYVSILKQLEGKSGASPEARASINRYAFRALVGLVSANSKANRSNENALLSLLGRQSANHQTVAEGLIAARNGAVSGAAGNAVKSKIELALLAIESNEKKKEVPAELSARKADLKLALARTNYALGDLPGAMSQYESLFKIGVPMQDALIESAWTQVRMEKYGKAIGLSIELETGKLAQFFAPEASSIRAISFLENCRYSEAKRSIERFSARYTPIVAWLKDSSTAESLYELAIARAEKSIGDETIPEQIWSMWSGSDLFSSLQSAIQASFSEERSAREWIAAEVEDASLRGVLLSDIAALEKSRAQSAQMIESHLVKLNKALMSRIGKETERMRWVRIETNQGAGRDLIYLNTHPEIKKLEKEIASAEAPVKKPKGALKWGKVELYDPNAETWIDEIGAYEGQALNRCGLAKSLQAAN